MDEGSGVGKVMGESGVVKSSSSQLGEESHMWRWGHIGLWGRGAIAGGGVVSNESVLFLAFNTFTGHLLGTWPCAMG